MKYLILLLSIVFLAACSQKNENPDKRLQEKEVPDDFEIGIAENGTYTNNYFNFTFDYDTTWAVQSFEELQKLMDAGQELVAGDDEAYKNAIKASQVRTATLFGAFKYEVNAMEESNPNILIIAENIKQFPGSLYGDDYLEKVRDMWGNSQMDIKQIGTIRAAPIDGKEFYKMTGEITTLFGSARQDYYCIILKDFALVFALTYTNESELEILEEIVATMQFD